MTVRLQKFLSEAGVASRREGEKLILSGKIAVDGQVVRLLGTKVDPAKNEVTLNGKPVQAKMCFTFGLVSLSLSSRQACQ